MPALEIGGVTIPLTGPIDRSRGMPAADLLLPVLLLAGALLPWGCARDDSISPAAGEDPPREMPAATVSPRAERLLADGPISGIALGLHSQDPSYDYRPLLEEIAATGAPWVELCFNYYQERNDSTEIGIPDPRSPPWRRVATTIREAHDLGLRVLLFPVVLIRDPGEEDWRGTIDPEDRERWHASYRRLIVAVARGAEKEGVEILSIGSEFNSRQGDRREWVELINRIRRAYSGAITYSANWDSLDGVSFIDRIDFIGMTTYFSLTSKNNPTVEELTGAWQDLKGKILHWRKKHGLPLIFTEVGYASQDGANRNPWTYYTSTAVDLEEQVDCFEAFTRVWRGEPTLSGVFFYNWFGVGGAGDSGYTPRGKPALEVIRRWFE
ncbi:MAG: hypothetical protein ACE5GW_05685 [Planctomycetota bacterium]